MLTSKGAQPAQQKEKLEADNFYAFDDALDAVTDQLSAKGIVGVDGEPDVVILLRHNGNVATVGNVDKLISVTAYIGYTKEEIAADIPSLVQNPQ